MATNQSNLLHNSSSDEETPEIFEVLDCTSDEEMSEYESDQAVFDEVTNSEDSDSDTPINSISPIEEQDVQRIDLAKRKSSSSTLSAKRLQVRHNTSSRPLKEQIHISYIGERQTPTHEIAPIFDISKLPPNYFTAGKNWEKRKLYSTNELSVSSSGLPRIDLFLYALEANSETNLQLAKINHRRMLSSSKTPIERFYPDLWDITTRGELSSYPFFNEPFEDALRIKRVPSHMFEKVPPAITEPTEPLHHRSPPSQHVLSKESGFLLETEEPIHFFDAIFRKYEFISLLNEMKRYRKQKNLDKASRCAIPSYEEIRCFIGLLLWTSLAKFPNRRAYFMNSEIFNLPRFKKHTTRERFEQLILLLHFADNEQIPEDTIPAKRFEAKLGNFISNYNNNCKKLLSPAKELSIDEMMIKFYGRSVVRQYIKAKPTKYGVKLWAICCGCCGYSFTQDMYLGGTAGHVGGRDVVLQLSEPFLDKGHVIYCDRFFSHLDLAAYLRSRKTGMVGTTSATSLLRDIDYLVKHMHPLTWAYKWFQHDADFKFHNKGIVQDMRAKESVSLIVWMDKKYRTEDKKVVFITNCLPNIPQSADQFQEKNIRDGQHKYSRQPVPSPPIVKAYNNRMGGVDRHDRLVGHHSIPLSSKRGYVKVFFHLLDSAVVNSWILFKTAQKSKGKWSLAEERRYTLAWFKESVILSLCGTFTSRKQTPSLNLSKPVLPTLTIRQATLHQIKPVSQISGMVSTLSKCIGCGCLKRTAVQSANCHIAMTVEWNT